MNDKFIETITNLSSKKTISFLANTENKMTVKINDSDISRDTSWIDFIEETIPFIDTIVRKPRNFIVQEEEILPIEKTKSITQDSIKFLATHTSLIQDYNEKDGVKPLKMLNIFKEETNDLYENRFIYSLLINVRSFLNDQLTKTRGITIGKRTEKLFYNSQTSLKEEDIRIKLNIERKVNKPEEESRISEVLEERIKKNIEVFDYFLSTKFAKSLTNVTPVRSPIRKTNVILKEKNFIKCVDLWEFLEKFNPEKALEVKETEMFIDGNNIIDKIKMATYLEYNTFLNISNIESEKIINTSLEYLKLIIEKYVKENQTTEQEFKFLINSEFKKAHEKKEKEYIDVAQEFKHSVIKCQLNIEKALAILD